MIIGYPSIFLTGSPGVTASATHVTTLAGVVDGRAGGLTRLAWGGSVGSPNASEQVTVSSAASCSPRLAALVNLEGLPAGLSVDVALKKASGGGYTYESQTVETHLTPSGDVCVIVTWPDGLDECNGVRFTVSNTGDVVAFDDEFSLGEAVLADGLEVNLGSDWSRGISRPAGENVSKSGQLYLQPVPRGRSLNLSMTPQLIDGALLDAGSVSDLQMALAEDPRCVVIADTTSKQTIEATWLYGYARRLGSLRGRRDQRLAASFEFVEMVGRST